MTFPVSSEISWTSLFDWSGAYWPFGVGCWVLVRTNRLFFNRWYSVIQGRPCLTNTSNRYRLTIHLERVQCCFRCELEAVKGGLGTAIPEFPVFRIVLGASDLLLDGLSLEYLLIRRLTLGIILSKFSHENRSISSPCKHQFLIKVDIYSANCIPVEITLV
jgi:hypothetical protein